MAPRAPLMMDDARTVNWRQTSAIHTTTLTCTYPSHTIHCHSLTVTQSQSQSQSHSHIVTYTHTRDAPLMLSSQLPSVHIITASTQQSPSLSHTHNSFMILLSAVLAQPESPPRPCAWCVLHQSPSRQSTFSNLLAKRLEPKTSLHGSYDC